MVEGSGVTETFPVRLLGGLESQNPGVDPVPVPVFYVHFFFVASRAPKPDGGALA